MITIIELIAAINEQPNLFKRADDFLYASARQADKTQYTNATALLDEVVNILRDNPVVRTNPLNNIDVFISQIAYEFTRLQQMNRAGNAVNFIADTAIKNEALGRMAIERAKVSLQDASNIAQAITDSTIKNETIGAVAIAIATQGNLTTARTVVAQITDAGYAAQIDRQCVRESSKGL